MEYESLAGGLFLFLIIISTPQIFAPTLSAAFTAIFLYASDISGMSSGSPPSFTFEFLRRYTFCPRAGMEFGVNFDSAKISLDNAELYVFIRQFVAFGVGILQ